MQQFCLTAPAPSPVSATPWDETARPLQLERPARISAEAVELDDEKIVAGGEAFFVVELCLEESPSPVCEGEKLPVPSPTEVG